MRPDLKQAALFLADLDSHFRSETNEVFQCGRGNNFLFAADPSNEKLLKH